MWWVDGKQPEKDAGREVSGALPLRTTAWHGARATCRRCQMAPEGKERRRNRKRGGRRSPHTLSR